MISLNLTPYQIYTIIQFKYKTTDNQDWSMSLMAGQRISGLVNESLGW